MARRPHWRMRKFIAAALSALCCLAASSAELTAAETRWLEGAWPVLQHARQVGLPMDVVVQPQPAAGLPPLAMAWVEGRCKMVFSLRGNPEAEATLRRIDPALLDVTLELMAAHELAHCWRHVSGRWRQRPDGSAGPDDQALRLEEGLADLVGLAWIRQRRAAHYGALQAWLRAERLHERLPGSAHDTLRWVECAGRGEALDGDSIFEPALALWRRMPDDSR